MRGGEPVDSGADGVALCSGRLMQKEDPRDRRVWRRVGHEGRCAGVLGLAESWTLCSERLRVQNEPLRVMESHGSAQVVFGLIVYVVKVQAQWFAQGPKLLNSPLRFVVPRGVQKTPGEALVNEVANLTTYLIC